MEKTDKLGRLHEIEREYGDLVVRMAVSHVFDVGARNLCSFESLSEIDRYVEECHEGDGAKRREGGAIMGAGFERALQRCSWELARSFSAAEIVCWCERRGYFSVCEWQDVEE